MGKMVSLFYDFTTIGKGRSVVARGGWGGQVGWNCLGAGKLDDAVVVERRHQALATVHSSTTPRESLL